MIEKNIFQTFFTKELPDPIISIINHHKSENPDYRYYFFDDNDINCFINDTFDSTIRQAYNALQIGAAKADLWRYLVLYKNGGVYLDLDSKFNVPINQIIKNEDKAIVTRECRSGFFVQWCLFFQQEHPVLKKIIEAVVDNILKCVKEKKIITDYIELYNTTGPSAITKVIEEHFGFINNGKSIYDRDDNDLTALIPFDRKDHIRFFGTDYNELCSFKHQYGMFLNEPYIRKKPWVEELKTTPLVKW